MMNTNFGLICSDKIICGRRDNWLELSKIRIEYLPKDFECYGSMMCGGSSLKELPENLYVTKNLYIGESQISFLPKGLMVGGDLILLNSHITELPSDICVGGKIIATQIKNKPCYIKNTVYNNFICDNEGKVFIFRKKYTFITKTNLTIDIYSPRLGNSLLIYDNIKQEFFYCDNEWQGIQKIERENFKNSIYYIKYIDYDITEKRFVKELLQIYKDITGEEIVTEVIKENKYSIEEFCHLIQEPGTMYTFLFNDYFLNREKF